MKAKLTFYGGVGKVTGSNFLFDIDGKKVLIDCGLFQGCNTCDSKNFEPFPYDPKDIDFLFITHGHLDHIGRIPRLIKNGFNGKIISTPPTKEISELIFIDGLHILKEEAKKNGSELIYNEKDIKKTMNLWETFSYHNIIDISQRIKVSLRDAGHILGSAMIEFKSSVDAGKKIIFTGDLGNSPSPLLPDTETIHDADYLVMESVYGDRNHEDRKERKEKLEDVIERTVKERGVLLIPAFSIERTQEILFEIENMMENSLVPLIPVFLDSPLAIKITEIYKKYSDYFKKEIQENIRTRDGIFAFPQLHLTQDRKASQEINKFANPKIIIAGSGMSNGGRILSHEKEYLPDPSTTLLIVGYQAPGSLGRELQDGARKIKIDDTEISVKARVENITGYSAHKDMDSLINFVSDTSDKLEKVFVVMGEPKSSIFLTQRLRDYIGVDAYSPQKEGESVILDF